jgi:hypothetical protein
MAKVEGVHFVAHSSALPIGLIGSFFASKHVVVGSDDRIAVGRHLHIGLGAPGIQ